MAVSNSIQNKESLVMELLKITIDKAPKDTITKETIATEI